MPSLAVYQKKNIREKEWITKEVKKIIEKKKYISQNTQPQTTWGVNPSKPQK